MSALFLLSKLHSINGGRGKLQIFDIGADIDRGPIIPKWFMNDPLQKFTFREKSTTPINKSYNWSTSFFFYSNLWGWCTFSEKKLAKVFHRESPIWSSRTNISSRRGYVVLRIDKHPRPAFYGPPYLPDESAEFLYLQTLVGTSRRTWNLDRGLYKGRKFHHRDSLERPPYHDLNYYNKNR